MTYRATRTHIAIASLLTLLLMAMAAVPANAASVKRSEKTERYVHKMVNCLRTGGKITSDGRCLARGTGKHSKYVPPLEFSAKISNRVSYPWARKSVKFFGTSTCWIGHQKAGSTVDSRFKAANFNKRIANGENMGCGRYSTPRKNAVVILRMWQNEKSWYGPHWRQLKSKKFKSAGYGVAIYGKSKTQILVDFFGKAVD